MKRSIFLRHFLMTAGTVFLSFVILGVMFFFWSYNLIMQDKVDSMKSVGDEVARTISLYSLAADLDGLEMRLFLTSFSSISGFDLLLTDQNGSVISCSDAGITCVHMGKRVPPDLLYEIRSRPAYIRLTDMDGVYDSTRYVFGVVVPPPTSPGYIGFLFVSSESEEMSQFWRQFAGVFMIIAVAVLFLIFVMTYFTTKKQTVPLNEMAGAARRFARGDFSTRVENDGRRDEIGQLMDAFNSMADSLERSENLRRDFIANISHELKTPMTVISGFSDGILDGTIPAEQQRKYLEVISSETKRMSRLVRNMLDMSRLQSEKREEILLGSFDISEVIRVTLLSFDGRIEAKGLNVAAELPEEAIMTRGDKDAITQVVYNLIDNAVKFADEGGAIRLSLWKQGQRAYVSVENTGATIPSSEMPLIFERFHKVDRSRSENREGVGLGLYIVKTILDNHNEDIYVTSGKGVTRFTFTLRLAGH